MGMNIGYQVSKNRLTTSVSLEEEQSFRLRRMASDLKVKVSPFVGRLIDEEWERRRSANQESATESEAAA